MSRIAQPRRIDTSEFAAVQRVVGACWAIEGAAAGRSVGAMTWNQFQHASHEHDWRIVLWEDATGTPVGWARLDAPRDGDLQVIPRLRAELVPEAIGWLEAEARAAGARELEITVFDRDTETVAALDRWGYRPTGQVWNGMRRRLDRLPQVAVPPGFRIRPMAASEPLAARVAVHRAAFSIQGSRSRVTEQSYAAVTRTPPYRPELDWIAELPDGRAVSFCLVWLDEANRMGEMEPVGTDPEFWRRGLASATCAAALAALREAGARLAVVASVDLPGRPSAPALYRKLGFRTYGHDRVFRRSL